MNTPAPRRSACALLLSAMMIAQALPAAANDLRNPGFEQIFTSWWSYGSIQVENWHPRTGNLSAVLPGWVDGGYGGAGQDIGMPARPGDIVTYSVYGYAEQNYTSTTAETFLQVEFWTNGAGAASQMDKKFVYAQLDGSRQAWTLLTMTATNTLDDVTMVKGLFGGGGWTNWAAGQMACYVDDADLTPRTGNKLADAGFEDGGAWWSYGNVGREAWASQTGRTGFAFYGWVNGGYGGAGQDVTVDPNNGKIYEFSIWGLAEGNYSSSANETWLKLEFYEGATKVDTVQQDIYGALTAHPNTWQHFTMTVTNTSDAITKVVAIVGGGNWTDTGGYQSAKWDNGYVRQIVLPEPVGAVVACAILLMVRSRQVGRHH